MMKFWYNFVEKNNHGEIVFYNVGGVSVPYLDILKESYTFGLSDKIYKIYSIVSKCDKSNSLHKIDKYNLTLQQVFPKLKVDDRVLVRDSKREKWRKRHFHFFTSDGRIMVYDSGKTSWSGTGKEDVCIFNQWKLPEE